MPLQQSSSTTLLRIPQPNRGIKAGAGYRATIRAPGQRMYPLGMSLKHVETTPTFHVPQPDRPIPTRAGQRATIGGKRQSAYPTGTPSKARNADGRPRGLHLPQPNPPTEAAA